MAAKTESRVYALARATHQHGYGHLTVYVYELFGYASPTLKISCQAGGNAARRRTYAWEFGLSNGNGVLKGEACRLGYLLMRRIDKALAELEAVRGQPDSFAEYAARVLYGAGVSKAYVLSGINASIRGEVTDLPCFNPRRKGYLFADALITLETQILGL